MKVFGFSFCYDFSNVLVFLRPKLYSHMMYTKTLGDFSRAELSLLSKLITLSKSTLYVLKIRRPTELRTNDHWKGGCTLHSPALVYLSCQCMIFCLFLCLFRVYLFFFQGANFTNMREIVLEIDENSDTCMNQSPLVRLHSLVKRHNWKDNNPG